jgi:hypothetical protein
MMPSAAEQKRARHADQGDGGTGPAEQREDELVILLQRIPVGGHDHALAASQIGRADTLGVGRSIGDADRHGVQPRLRPPPKEIACDAATVRRIERIAQIAGIAGRLAPCDRLAQRGHAFLAILTQKHAHLGGDTVVELAAQPVMRRPIDADAERDRRRRIGERGQDRDAVGGAADHAGVSAFSR